MRTTNEVFWHLGQKGSGSLRFRRRIPHGNREGSCIFLSSDESDEDLVKAHRTSLAPTSASSSAELEYSMTPPGEDSLLMASSRLNRDWTSERRGESTGAHQSQPVVGMGPDKQNSLLERAPIAVGTEFTTTSRNCGPQQRVPGVTTTVMIRNIPLRYTPVSLREVVDEGGFQGKYDYFYMPMDFRSYRSLGYCFINFYDPGCAAEFATNFENRKFSINSEKVLSVSGAARQGLLANVASFKLSTLKQMPKIEFRPLVAILGHLVPLDEEVYTWLLTGTHSLSGNQNTFTSQSTAGLMSMLSDPSIFS